MLEARLDQAVTLKKILDAVKDLVTDANFDCSEQGIALQAMDSSHVALVALLLRSSGFDHFRCDRALNLGISIANLGRILKTAGNDDVVTLRADDKPDVLNLVFESPSTLCNTENDRVCEYDLKLMDIDSEHLGIPDTVYDATIRMPSQEFQRICRDMVNLADSVVIEVDKDGVTFSAEGDIGSGAIKIKPGSGAIDEDEEDCTTIELNQACTLTFSLKYLSNFTKATPLSKTVSLSMSTEVPLLVEYKVSEIGYIRYYLAPKMNDAE